MKPGGLVCVLLVPLIACTALDKSQLQNLRFFIYKIIAQLPRAAEASRAITTTQIQSVDCKAPDREWG